jgi:hypothetical protein
MRQSVSLNLVILAVAVWLVWSIGGAVRPILIFLQNPFVHVLPK